MQPEIWIGAMSLIGTLIGTLGGILVSNKLTCYRIEQLEKRVGEHNNFARRMPLVEQKIEFIEEQFSELKHSK